MRKKRIADGLKSFFRRTERTHKKYPVNSSLTERVQPL